jgi:KDO2-lipid IV(A) lauroyltransferase
MPSGKGRAILDYLVYLGLRTGVMLIQACPMEVMQAAARVLGWLLFRLDRKHRLRAIDHLTRSFGDEWPEAKIRKTALRCCQHLVMLGIEILSLAKMINRYNWYRYVELGRIDDALRVVLDDRGIIIVTGHFGNWELIGYVIGALGIRTYAVARPIDNPYIERWILGTREETGQTIINKFGATDLVVRVIESRQPLCFLADQHAGRRGVWVDFFGRKASTYRTIALLSLQMNCPIAVGGAWRLGNRFRFRGEMVDVIDPEDYRDDPDPVTSITARYTKSLENLIRRAPEQYLWMHRRWRDPPPPRKKKTAPPKPSAAENNQAVPCSPRV